MIWAIKNNNRIKATPKEIAFCPICHEEVIAKCGSIKIWHWSHKSLKDCDNWAEPESEWHINWKNQFPKEQQEIVITKGGDVKRADNFNLLIKSHRADIKTMKGLIIELQNSQLSSDKIIEREMFYQNMIWILNGEKLCKGLELRFKKGIITFRWKNPPKSWWVAKKPIYIDLVKDELIFSIKKLYPNIPCGGWGIILTKEQFLKEYGNK